MSLRSTRIIILLFAIFLSLGGFLYRLYRPDVSLAESYLSLLAISFLCLLLYGMSFLKYFIKHKNLISHTFQTLAASWLIILTALNHFLPDYAYSLIFTVIMLGLMFEKSNKFALFYSLCFILLLSLSFFEKHSLIELRIYDSIFVIAGGFIYFILRLRETKQSELEIAQISAKSILHSSVGFFFFLNKDYKILSFNNYAEEKYRDEMHMELKTGNSIFSYMPENTHESLRETLDCCVKGEIIKNEKQVIYPNGPTVWVENTFVPVYDDNKKFLGISFQTSNISPRKNAEEALKDSESRFRQLAESAFEGLIIHDNGIILDVNTQGADMVGYEIKDLIGKSILDITLPEYHEQMRKKLRVPYEIEAIHANGSVIPVEIMVKPFITNGKFMTVAAVRDISDRKKAETALKESEQKFRELADNLPLMIYEIDNKGEITYFNKASHTITGYTIEDYKNGVKFTDMFPPYELERALYNVKEIMKGNKIGMFEYTMVRKDGSLYNAIFNTVPVYKDGKIIGRRGVVTDITQLKAAEEKIKSSLKEKEILLGEIHHRVKNNLQIISSLLRLQANNITDPRVLEVFRDAQNRILTMGLVHERLYKAENFSNIDTEGYIKDLVSTILSSYSSDAAKVYVTIEVDPIALNLDTMIPVGLLINELLTNCIKHAFKGRDKGDVILQLKNDTNGKYCLCIKDDGIGFPDDIDIENSESFGLKLVQVLAQQVHGKMEIKNDTGSKISITFAEVKKEPKQ